MNRDQVLERVSDELPHLSIEAPEAAVVAVLRALAEQLGRADAAALAEELPSAWATHVLSAPHCREPNLADVFIRVSALERIRLGEAVEHTFIVGQALGAFLSPDSRTRLLRTLGEKFTRVLSPMDLPEPLERMHLHPECGTLAEGRPGSRHPIATGGPMRHSHSVVAEANPHGDTKLSGSEGLTQEREETSLADFRR